MSPAPPSPLAAALARIAELVDDDGADLPTALFGVILGMDGEDPVDVAAVVHAVRVVLDRRDL